jgi:hypothetical protein
MATVEHAVEEHDLVAPRVSIGTWLATASGTVVSLYDGAALVEVAEDDPPGSALDTCRRFRSRSLSCAGATALDRSTVWQPDGSPRDRAVKRSTALM